MLSKACLTDECCTRENLTPEQHRKRCLKHWCSGWLSYALPVYFIWLIVATIALPFTGCPRQVRAQLVEWWSGGVVEWWCGGVVARR